MSDTSDTNAGAHPDPPAERTNHDTQPGRRKRPRRRVVLICLGSFLGLVIAAAVGTLLYVNHVVSSIPRIHVHGLAPATSSRETFLITAEPWGATGSATEVAALDRHPASNLVMLLHINADGATGGAVTIPGDVKVNVPGHGTQPIWDALEEGGPSLLVQTVTQVTGLPINHYARIDFNHITGLINAVGGVDVDVPYATTGYGYNFVKGINALNGVTAIYYARDPKLSDQDRLLRQENLVRELLAKIADDHLLTSPVTAVHVLNSITSMLTVDSNLTNSQVISLAGKFGKRSASSATYVTAATLTVHGQRVLNTAIDDQLWKAVKKDSIAAFARQYPSTLTPATAP